MIPSDRANEAEANLLDLAARAAWLSFVGGMTQDQIALELGISRQRVQRLVARASAEGLIRVRIDHPIAECLELEQRLRDRYGLFSARVAPSLSATGDPNDALAPFAAPLLERFFTDPAPKLIALGTGRTLRMIVEQMQSLAGGHHKLVSLIGNVAPDGSASHYEVIVRLAEKVSAPHFPMSIPVVAASEAERDLYRSLPHVKASIDLALRADFAIVGMGQMGADAPLLMDGFITPEEHADWVRAGAIGEIGGHAFNAEGQFLDHPMSRRIVGARVPHGDMQVHCFAAGQKKLPALTAALKGRLLSHLVTDERTAKALLND
ncbi:sugar-binding transcriptional regulator [Thioclava sp. GXIMD4215]|uniref:sugar-binding transcriptional regulator n=1 Tax=Thioclava sp. GXIMD4215 TaxID=3131928 RepID=UPI00324D8ADF